MELEELLQREGLQADELADTLAWARDRAEELVSGLVADAELGPLLDGDFTSQVPAKREPDAPKKKPGRRGANKRVPAKKDAADAVADVPPPRITTAPMAEAAHDPGSVAKRLPGPDDPVDDDDGDGPRDETTQPRALPSDGPGVTTSGAIEIDAAEIELLDEDDLELVEEPGDAAPPNIPAPPADEVPEWKAALTSATLGGDSKADRDSGLHRIPSDEAGDALTDPSKGAPPPTPKKLGPLPAEHDESMEIDLGEF